MTPTGTGTVTRMAAALPALTLRRRWPPRLAGGGGGVLAREQLVSGGCCYPTLVTEPMSGCHSTAGCPGARQGLCLGLLQRRGGQDPFPQGQHGDRSALPAVIHCPAKPHRFLLLPAAQPSTMLPAQAPQAVPCSQWVSGWPLGLPVGQQLASDDQQVVWVFFCQVLEQPRHPGKEWPLTGARGQWGCEARAPLVLLWVPVAWWNTEAESKWAAGGRC